jgi:hypothetical protein
MFWTFFFFFERTNGKTNKLANNDILLKKLGK